MKPFKHWKTGTIYNHIADTIPFENREEKPQFHLSALHHETQEVMLFSLFDDAFISPNEETYVLYESTKDGRIWARETEDFYGYKEHENGERELRFTPMNVDITYQNEQKYERPAVDIQVPDNYSDLLKQTLKNYKKWLKENEKFQEQANQAETEENRENALKQGTEHFKKRYAGVVAKDLGDRLSVSQIKNIWEKFMKDEYRSFLNAHVNLTMEQIIKVGIDKLIYVLGWRRPSDVATWHNNKVRIGACCHCQDQFVPMMLQYNKGLCANCRPLYSDNAIRQFVVRQLNTSKRYELAQRDLLMDFFIMFYHDAKFRNLFVKDSGSAKEMESWNDEVPEWAKQEEE